nr:TPA_asm: PolB [False wolf spider monodnaparvovirus]
MAELLSEGVWGRYGYFYSYEFIEITSYLNDLLENNNESFLMTMHASALFYNNEHPEIVKEFHCQPTRPTTLDPDMPNFADVIQNTFEELTAPEQFESAEGSGWTLIPGTYRFWVNTIPFQPNNTPADNQRNSTSFDDMDDPDDPSPISPNNFLCDTLMLSIAAHHVQKTRYDTRLRYLARCQDWAHQNLLFLPETKITLSTLSEWHCKINRFWIRVFSKHGNVIYNVKKDNEEVIDLLWSNRKFKLITDLHGLLKEKNDRIFCEVCKKFHGCYTHCKTQIRSAKSEDMDVPEMPIGRHALVIYADFESYIDKESKQHMPSGACAIAIDKSEQQIWSYITDAQICDNVIGAFIRNLISFIDKWAYYDTKTDYCQICNELIDGESINGRNFINGDIGSHHLNCWNDYKNCAYIYFHNFRGYDSHLLLRDLISQTQITLIRGKTFEKFDIISAESGQRVKMCFKDTYNYFTTSLEKLASTVTDWRYTSIHNREGKGIFPYEWFDNPGKLASTSLPPPSEWFSNLRNANNWSEEAIEVWNREKMLTFRDYHNYYMNQDVTLLADVFEEFRRNSVSKLNYDPTYFQGAPSYTWFLCTNEFKNKFKIITNKDIYLDIQANIRGGVSQVIKRWQDTSLNDKILYLDVNSLYSRCMEYKMPTNYIETLYELPPNWEEMYAVDGDQCAIMCVDLHYPTYLHDQLKHFTYPLAPHKFEDRLCTTFLDKKKYLCHSNALSYYLSQGLIITKFHYMYIFNQDYVLADYVSRNIQSRIETDNSVMKTVYKLLNNSLYGKTCENKFKYRKFSIKNQFEGLYGKRNPFMFKSKNWLQIGNDILSEDDISVVTLDKPIQIGFTVLEMAKLEIYKFLYKICDYMSQLKIETQLLYTDTDSLLLYFNHPSPQNLLFQNNEIRACLDFEKVPSNWEVRTQGTDKVSGLWSLETDKEIQTFIGLRAKCYALKFSDNNELLKNKGISSFAEEVKSNDRITFDSYKRALFDNEEIFINQVLLRSKHHTVTSYQQTKLALSSLDEKRQVLPDKISTMPWGYRGIQISPQDISDIDSD